MTKEEKELLLKDLSARLPYVVICKGITFDIDVIKDEYVKREAVGPLTKIDGYNYVTLGITKECELSTIKPYLRPMSSMTRDEMDLYCRYIDTQRCLRTPILTDLLDWLNANHIDYRQLIEQGLALEAPVGMYNIK